MAVGKRSLMEQIDAYLAVRAATGHPLKREGAQLRNFSRFAETRGKQRIVAELAIHWASGSSSLWMRVNRIRALHKFVLYARAEGERHEIPPRDYFGSYPNKRPAPYIFTTTQIKQLLVATARMPSRGSQRNQVYTTLFALLTATGMRISEALNLKISDFKNGTLIIRNSKGKSRTIALHYTCEEALRVFLRGRKGPCATSDYILSNSIGGKIDKGQAAAVFRRAVDKAKIPKRYGVRGPVPHSLRHTFAVRALQSCANDPHRVAIHMRAVSDYLGHSDIAHTYWYYESTPQLMRAISIASERKVLG